LNQAVKSALFWGVILVAAVALWRITLVGGNQQSSPEISYSLFLSRVDAGDVAKVTISGNELLATDRNGGSFRVVVPSNRDAMIQTLRQKNVEIWFRGSAGDTLPAKLLGTWAPLILLAVLWLFMIRQMKKRSSPPPAGSVSEDTRWLQR